MGGPEGWQNSGDPHQPEPGVNMQWQKRPNLPDLKLLPRAAMNPAQTQRLPSTWVCHGPTQLPRLAGSSSPLTQRVALSVANVVQLLLRGVLQNEGHHGWHIVHGHLVETGKQGEKLEGMPIYHPPAVRSLPWMWGGWCWQPHILAVSLWSSSPEVPKLLLVDREVQVPLRPAVPPAVSNPHVITCVCQDEAQAAVGEIVHPVATI